MIQTNYPGGSMSVVRGGSKKVVIDKSPYSVEILGPRFIEPQRIMDLLAVESKERFEECVFGYRICDRIAKHIRELATAW